MKWNVRKLTAFALVMAIASPISVSAGMDEGNEIGTGKVEGIVDKDVYQVVLPTVSSHTFDFIIDPEELINQTGGAGYKGKTFEADATLFFRRTDNGAREDYSNTSNPITIINKGSTPIDVSLEVRMLPSSLGGIRMTKDRDFKGDTSTSLYLAVVDGNNVMPVGTDGVSIDTTLEAAPKDAFEYGYDKERGKYTYTLKKNLDNNIFAARSFQITGAANENGSWSEFTKVSPKMTVSWKIMEKKE